MYSLFKHLWCSEIPLGRIREAEVLILEFICSHFQGNKVEPYVCILRVLFVPDNCSLQFR